MNRVIQLLPLPLPALSAPAVEGGEGRGQDPRKNRFSFWASYLCRARSVQGARREHPGSIRPL